jgi:hypothetical protein
MALDAGRLTVSPFVASTLPPDEFLPRSTYESVRRCVRELRTRREVRVTARRPSPRELVELYPYQTKSSRVAFLRKRLLPALFRGAVTDSDDSAGRGNDLRYTRVENERHALATKLPNDGHAVLRSRWADVAHRMLQIEASLPPMDRAPVFALRVKCSEFCETTGAAYEETFDRLLRDLERSSSASPLIAEAVALMRSIRELLPSAEISQARLKTVLYGLVDLREGRTPALSEHARVLLRRAAPQIIEKLPGFKENVKRKAFLARRNPSPTWSLEAMHMRDEPDAFHDPLLDKLVGRDLFRRFQFIEPSA